MRDTVNLTYVRLENNIYFVMVSREIEANTNICGDEDVQGEILIKGDITEVN